MLRIAHRLNQREDLHLKVRIELLGEERQLAKRLAQHESRHLRPQRRREAVEELFELPEHRIVGAVAVQRVARRYEVFACRGRKKLRKTWSPTLDAEHTDFRWTTLEWAMANPDSLHPVVRALVEHDDGRAWLSEMLATRSRTYPGGRRSTDGPLSQGPKSSDRSTRS